MAVAKVTLNGSTLVDMTDATADESTIVEGSTAYIADGSKATGTAPSGGFTVDEVTKRSYTGAVSTDETSVVPFAFCQSGITSFSGPNVTMFRSVSPINGGYLSSQGAQFLQCRNLQSVYLPNLTTIYGAWVFWDCSALQTIALPKCSGKMDQNDFKGCTSLTAADFGPSMSEFSGSFNASVFRDCSRLSVLILRSTSVVGAGVEANFANTPFASGGTGGTIYIPKVLYDALGTGTNDYKAATLWSTLDGYGTITWAQIEGSIYETQYADGTPIT